MIKHIVAWKLKDSVDGKTKEENALEAKHQLEALNGVIPGLIKLEVGIDFSQTSNSADLALYSELESRDALSAYQTHPDHEAVKSFVMSIVSDRYVCDYEIH